MIFICFVLIGKYFYIIQKEIYNIHLEHPTMSNKISIKIDVQSYTYVFKFSINTLYIHPPPLKNSFVTNHPYIMNHTCHS